MVTMAQRIEALRTEAGLARVPASLELLSLIHISEPTRP